MFEESFMEFGAFPADLNVRKASCSNHLRFRDLGSVDLPSSSVSGGFFFSDVSTPAIVNPIMNDQCHLHHLKLNPSCRNKMVGLDGDRGLCQSLSRMNLSDVSGSRALAGFSGFKRSMRCDAEVFHGFHNVSSGREGSLYSSNGVSLGGLAVDRDNERLRLLGLLDYLNPDGLNEIFSRNSRDSLLGQRNVSFQQSLTNMDTGSGLRDVPVILQRRELHSQVNDPYNSSLMLGGNRVSKSLSRSAMEGCSQGPNSKISAKCSNNGSANEMESYFKDDQLENSGDDDGETQCLSLASMIGIHGSVYVMAKDQIGCRLLQKMFDEGTFLDVNMIFREVIDHLIDLTIDPFGNYFIQKLLEVCTEEQRTQIVIMMISKPGQLIKISLNTYGTRVVQKLIETLRTKKQIVLVTSALKLGFLSLVRDLNGNHVIQRCLQSLGPDDNEFVFEEATKFCVEIATHRHGCCVLQRCVSFAVGPHLTKLVAEISRNCLLLAQDPFGNYVVQYIIEQNVPVAYVLCPLREHYVKLSMQKFGSHVVEKCLRRLPESRSQIVRELVSVSDFEQLLQDPYANYVIQSAIAVTKGTVKASLVEKVRPYKNLRTSPYCKRIFSRSLSKK